MRFLVKIAFISCSLVATPFVTPRNWFRGMASISAK